MASRFDDVGPIARRRPAKIARSLKLCAVAGCAIHIQLYLRWVLAGRKSDMLTIFASAFELFR